MSPIRVTFMRTAGWSLGLFTTALAISGFLGAVGGLFVMTMSRIETGAISPVAHWAICASAALPCLAAFLAMGVWSDERQSGRIGLLLSVAVRERDFTLGKFLGVWFLLTASAVFSFVTVFLPLMFFSSGSILGLSLPTVASACVGLALQGALWSAAALAISALFSRASSSVVATVSLLVLLPRVIWAALCSWSRGAGSRLGEFPIDAHILDWTVGSFSFGTMCAYAIGTLVLLFIATKFIVFARLVGRGARALRASTALSVGLAAVFAILAVHLSLRVNVTADLPFFGVTPEFSSRTRGILSESSGEIVITTFLSRDDPRFRAMTHLLRSIRETAKSLGGARISVRHVDPRWDLVAAERLAARGVSEDSLVFERGRRFIVMPMKDGCDERHCASTIRRLTTTARRRNICWTVGHGEAALDGYGVYGFSDFVRDLSREGYLNSPIDLTSTEIPSDCALLIVAGPREGFSKPEIDRLDAYLRSGGRLLLVWQGDKGDSMLPLLLSWGLKPKPLSLQGVRTLSGDDVIVSDFSEHPIVARLTGSRIVLDRPVFFDLSGTVGRSADSLICTPLATVEGRAVAVSLERGAGAGGDLAIRPMRVVVIGDSSFALNGSLAARASANRDFLLNAVAYLAGADISDSAGVSASDAKTISSELDRSAYLNFTLLATLIFPGLVFLCLSGRVLKGRLRA